MIDAGNYASGARTPRSLVCDAVRKKNIICFLFAKLAVNFPQKPQHVGIQMAKTYDLM